MPANPGKHPLTARFYGPQGAVQEVTTSVTTEDATQSHTAGPEKATTKAQYTKSTVQNLRSWTVCLWSNQATK